MSYVHNDDTATVSDEYAAEHAINTITSTAAVPPLPIIVYAEIGNTNPEFNCSADSRCGYGGNS